MHLAKVLLCVSWLVVPIAECFAGGTVTKEMRITTVRGNNLIANRGSNDGVEVGGIYRLTRGGVVIGVAKVLVVKESLSGLKIVDLLRGREPRAGDFLVSVDLYGRQEEDVFAEMEETDLNTGDTIQPLRRQEAVARKVNRKGFIIGGGIGAGYLRNQASGFLFGTVHRATFLTDFKIGYAPTDAIEVYYVNKVSWWGELGTTVILSLSAIGFSVFPDQDTATGLFFTGGAGLSAADAPFENVNASYGFGLFAGAGYEFAKHFSLETNLLYSQINDFGIQLDSFALRLTLNVLGY